MKKSKLFLIVLSLSLLFVVTGCSSNNNTSNNDRGFYTREDGKRIWYIK